MIRFNPSTTNGVKKFREFLFNASRSFYGDFVPTAGGKSKYWDLRLVRCSDLRRKLTGSNYIPLKDPVAKSLPVADAMYQV